MADNKITDKSLKEKVLDNRLVRSIITVVAVMCVAFIILLVKINIAIPALRWYTFDTHKTHSFAGGGGFIHSNVPAAAS